MLLISYCWVSWLLELWVALKLFMSASCKYALQMAWQKPQGILPYLLKGNHCQNGTTVRSGIRVSQKQVTSQTLDTSQQCSKLLLLPNVPSITISLTQPAICPSLVVLSASTWGCSAVTTVCFWCGGPTGCCWCGGAAWCTCAGFAVTLVCKYT